LKILIVNYEYPPIGAGAANASWQIARELANEGHHPVVLTSSFKKLKGWAREDGVEIYRCKTRRKKAFQSNIVEMGLFIITSLMVIGKLMRKKEIDSLIVFFSFPCGPLGLYAKIRYKIPFIISLRGGDVPGAEQGLGFIHKVLTPIRRWLLKNATQIIANSTSLKEMSEKADPYTVEVIPNGVDTEYFSPSKDLTEKTQCFKFLFVGRFQPQKNLPYLIESIAELKNLTDREFELILAGDGYLKPEIEQMIITKKLSDVVKVLPWQDRESLRNLYRESDCFMLTSLYEGMSNVVLEAMACGLPVIASRVAGNKDLVVNGFNGYLFNLEERDTLILQMKNLLENRVSTSELGNNGRKMTVEKFSWKKVAGAYVSAFTKII
jgi:glycosyltransferase involved in cell wall biosynthesis